MADQQRSEPMSVTITVFLVYLLLLAGLALWSRRESQSMSGYFIAGKKLPPWVVAFSTNATGESGWLLLGLTGMGYAVGAQAHHRSAPMKSRVFSPLS